MPSQLEQQESTSKAIAVHSTEQQRGFQSLSVPGIRGTLMSRRGLQRAGLEERTSNSGTAISPNTNVAWCRRKAHLFLQDKAVSQGQSQPGNPVFPALLHRTFHHFDLLFPTSCVKTRDPNSPPRNNYKNPTQPSVILFCGSHVGSSQANGLSRRAPGCSDKASCWFQCTLVQIFACLFFFFLPFRAASSGAAPLLCPNLLPAPLSAPISANHREQDLNPT